MEENYLQQLAAICNPYDPCMDMRFKFCLQHVEDEICIRGKVNDDLQADVYIGFKVQEGGYSKRNMLCLYCISAYFTCDHLCLSLCLNLCVCGVL